MSKIAFGSPVTTCDCLLTGRVTMIWFVAPPSPPLINIVALMRPKVPR